MILRLKKTIGIQANKLSYMLNTYHSKWMPREIDFTKSKHCHQLQYGTVLTIEHNDKDLEIDQILNMNVNGQRIDDLNFLYLK